MSLCDLLFRRRKGGVKKKGKKKGKGKRGRISPSPHLNPHHLHFPPGGSTKGEGGGEG